MGPGALQHAFLRQPQEKNHGRAEAHWLPSVQRQGKAAVALSMKRSSGSIFFGVGVGRARARALRCAQSCLPPIPPGLTRTHHRCRPVRDKKGSEHKELARKHANFLKPGVRGVKSRFPPWRTHPPAYSSLPEMLLSSEGDSDCLPSATLHAVPCTCDLARAPYTDRPGEEATSFPPASFPPLAKCDRPRQSSLDADVTGYRRHSSPWVPPSFVSLGHNECLRKSERQSSDRKKARP